MVYKGHGRSGDEGLHSSLPPDLNNMDVEHVLPNDDGGSDRDEEIESEYESSDEEFNSSDDDGMETRSHESHMST